MITKLQAAFASSLFVLFGCGPNLEPLRRAHLDAETLNSFSRQVDRSFAEAVCRGDADGMRAALIQGADVNARGRNEMTPVRVAVRCGSLQGLELVLSEGGRPISGAVLDAAQLGNSQFLETLLQHGGDPNASTQGGPWSALRIEFSMGAQGRGWDGYYALLNAGADINRGEDSIAEFAATLNQYDKVAELLDRGYNRDLGTLALLVRNSNAATLPPEQVQWAERVKARLAATGAAN